MKRVSFIPALLLCGVSWAQTPAIVSGGIANGASFGLAPNSAITAGSLISVFGTNLASGTAAADSIPLSTSLGGVSVTINGTPAPLNYVCHNCVGGTGDQLNIQAPWELTGSTADVVVKNSGGTSAPASIALAQFNPGIFSVNNGVGVAIAFFVDGALAAPAGSIPGLTTHPAKVGDTLQILATGLGAVDSPVNTGAASLDKLRNTMSKPTVLIGNTQAQVAFSGLAPQFVGVNQINAVVASGTPAGNAVPLQLQMGNLTTTNQVTIAVSQ